MLVMQAGIVYGDAIHHELSEDFASKIAIQTCGAGEAPVLVGTHRHARAVSQKVMPKVLQEMRQHTWSP